MDLSLDAIYQGAKKYWLNETVQSLLESVRARDPYTFHHSINVGIYAYRIAKQLLSNDDDCLDIYLGAILHDVGKIGIPDSILLKDGKLTNEEFTVMKTHPQIGFDITQAITHFKDRGVDKIVLYHHERPDGKGYPFGIISSEIPLGAKIVAVADTYDAMTTKRLYRPSLCHAEALEELLSGKGAQFDPMIVDAFMVSLKGYSDMNHFNEPI